MRIIIVLGCFYIAFQNIMLFARNGLDLTAPDQIALLAVTILLIAAGAFNAYLFIKNYHSKENETQNEEECETENETVTEEED